MINFSQLMGRAQRPSAPATTNYVDGSLGLGLELDVPTAHVRISPETRLVLHTDPHSPGADRFRLLKMPLQEMWDSKHLRTVLITSPLPGDGKSTIALNLATALAEGGKRRVLLIEADLYHPTLGEKLGLQTGSGFAECLAVDADPWAAIRRLEPVQWYFLPAGKTRTNPTELLQSGAVPRVLQKLAHSFDWILIDTPPITPLTDSVSLVKHSDASLLVVRADRTPQAAIEEALSRLGPKHVLGIVLNGAESLNRLYSKYHGHYGQEAKLL